MYNNIEETQQRYEINDMLIDYFDLSENDELEESIDDFYTLDEVCKLVEDRIKILNTLAYHLKPAQIVEYRLLEGKDVTAGVKSVNNNKYLFVLSKYAARKRNDIYMDSIIYHELCHILQLELSFELNILYYKNGKLYSNEKDRSLVDTYYKNNDGHTDLWYRYVNALNKLLHPFPSITETFTNEDLQTIFQEALTEVDSFEVDDTILDTFR